MWVRHERMGGQVVAELKDDVHRRSRYCLDPGPKVARPRSADNKRTLSAVRHRISLLHYFVNVTSETRIREHRRINAEALEEVFESLVPHILKIPVEGGVVDLTRILAALQLEKVLARLPFLVRTGVGYCGKTAVKSNRVEEMLQLRIWNPALRDLLQESLDGIRHAKFERSIEMHKEQSSQHCDLFRIRHGRLSFLGCQV
jgi:hypothetical protein